MAKTCVTVAKAGQYPLLICRANEFKWISISPSSLNDIPEPGLLYSPLNHISLEPESTHLKPNIQGS